jgi:cytosine/adenosine deaminase-related metal-dependent hydrolase
MHTVTAAIRARWVFPVDGPPIEDAVIELDGARIATVRAAAGREPDALDLGNVAVIPGLVNVHTHLEFSGLRQPLGPAAPFAEWIRAVVASRRARGGTRRADVCAGLSECAASGTTTVGEIATPGWSPECFGPGAPRAVVFRELIALDNAAAGQQLDVAREHLSTFTTHPHLRPGISPHAPYSVCPELFAGLVELAVWHGAPLAFHLAETREELELLERGTGPLVDLFRSTGFWREDVIAPGTRPLDYLQTLAAAPRSLVIHGNYLDDAEIEFLAGHPQLTLVYCPRTHAYFGHAPHPWRTVLERGGRVALGTDSRASNPDLSQWEELRFLRRRFPEVDAALLLRLATLDGARALGLEDQIGSLSPGKQADIVVMALSSKVPHDPHDVLFGEARVMATMKRGEWISGSPLTRPPAAR